MQITFLQTSIIDLLMGCSDSVLLNKQFSAEKRKTKCFQFSKFIVANKCRIFEYYHLNGWISRNNSVSIRSAIHKLTNVERVVKIYVRSQQNMQKAMAQINALKKLDHPSVVRLYQYFIDETFIYIVLEKVNGRPIFYQILGADDNIKKNFPDIFRQILSAVEYCHSNGVVHRNITPDNILIIQNQRGNSSTKFLVKLVDFAQVYFMPPEQIQSYNKRKDQIIKTNSIKAKTESNKSKGLVSQSDIISEQSSLDQESVIQQIKTSKKPLKPININNYRQRKSLNNQQNLMHFQKLFGEKQRKDKNMRRRSHLSIVFKEQVQNLNIDEDMEITSISPKNQLKITNIADEPVRKQEKKIHLSIPAMYNSPIPKSKIQKMQMKIQRKSRDFGQPPGMPNLNTVEKIDIWFCGLLLLKIISGQNFSNQDNAGIKDFISKLSLNHEHNVQTINLLKEMLNQNPFNRPSAFQCLQQHFFKKQAKQNCDSQKLSMYKNLYQIQLQHDLRSLFTMYLARQFITNKEESEYLIEFYNLDKNKDGKLQYHQVVQGIMNCFLIEQKQASEYADKIFKSLDKNKNGCLDYSQFLMGTLNVTTIIRQDNIRKLFNEIDNNKDGYITEEQLRILLKNINHQCELDQLFKERKSFLRRINFEQFSNYINRIKT